MATEISETTLEHDLHNVLTRAARGEEIIVKLGQGTGVLMRAMTELPEHNDASNVDKGEAIEAMLAFRRQHSLDGLTIRELIDEGRKY